MSYLRSITLQEIESAQHRGDAAVQGNIKEILSGSQNRENLKDLFRKVADISKHLLDNFDPHKYQKRGHTESDPDTLKVMILGAVQSVHSLGYIEGHIHVNTAGSAPMSSFTDRLSLWAQRVQHEFSLRSAIHTYQTNGQSMGAQGAVRAFFHAVTHHRLEKEGGFGLSLNNQQPLPL